MRRPLLLLILTLALAGCNLDSDISVQLAPSPTPLVVATATPDPLVFVTPIPEQVLLDQPEPPAESQNAIDVFVNNFLIPIWNFLYTFVSEGVTSLWVFAGARGGAFAQVFCCIAPVALGVGLVLMRFGLWIRRR